MRARFDSRMVRRAAAGASIAAALLVFVLTASARRVDVTGAPAPAPFEAASAVPVEATLADDPATQVRFRLQQTCGSSITYTFWIGNTAVGSANGNADCSCNGGYVDVNVTNAAHLALIGAPACTLVKVSSSGVSYMAFARADITRQSGATERLCMFDFQNNNCGDRTLCGSGSSYQYGGQRTFSNSLPDDDGDGIVNCADTDEDNDGVDDGTDNCPLIANASQRDTDADGAGDACDTTGARDDDEDGILDAADNCPAIRNASQLDSDGNGQGDACDSGWDLDNDGIANAEDNCPSVSNRKQTDSDGDAKGDACDTEPVLAAVPWFGHESIPYPVHSGGSVILQAVFAVPSTGDPVPYASATWDAGDGSPISFSGQQPSTQLARRQTYTGVVGQPFTATVRVVDMDGKVHTDTVKVVIAPDNRETRANMAISAALFKLHTEQVRTTADGLPATHWGGSGYTAQATAASTLQAFQINNHRESTDPTIDPYATVVARGMRWLLSTAGTISRIDVPSQNGNNPDANGNGYGLSINNNDHTPYVVGQVIDAIVASGTPGKLAVTGQAEYVKGRKYSDLVQDMLDGYSYGMGDDRGGWHYGYAGTSGGNDTSASHWWAIGVLAAETWGMDAPEWVKNIQRTVGLPLMQAYPGDGHFGYTNNTNAIWDDATNVTAAGLVLMNADDVLPSHGRFGAASGYVNARYQSSMGNFYTMYQLTKAMRTARGQNLEPAPITLLAGTRDWYAGYADHLIANQNVSTGAFTSTVGTAANYITGNLANSWGVIMLSTSLFELPPSAACTANPSQVGSNGGNITFSAASSFHPDANESIVSYAWNFDDGTAAGSGVTTTHNFTRPASFPTTRNVTVTVTDSQGLSATSSCPVTIVDTNVAPNANAGGPYSMCPDETVILDGTTSTDEDGTIAPTAYKWSWGAVINFDAPNAIGPTVNAWAAFQELAVGTHNIGLQVTDNDGATNSEFTTVTVKAASDPSCNQAPTAVDDTASTFSYTPVAISVLANDSDPNAGDTLTVTWHGGAANGTPFLAGNVITYTPNLGFAGTDTFSYAISDGKGGTGSANVTITVTKRAATITAGSGSKVYGSTDPALTPSLTGFLPGDGITASPDGRDPGEDVGSYRTRARASGTVMLLQNYDVTYTTGTLVITKATPVADAVGGGFTFDGQPHAGTCSVTGVGGVQLAGTISYSSGGAPVNAGNYTLTCAFAGDANYEPASDSDGIVIDKAASTAVATGGTFTFDTQPHGGTCSVTGAGGALLPGTISYSTGGEPVNAGNHTVTCSFAGDGNYDGSSDTEAIAIDKAASTAVATGATATYDGQSHGGTCAVTGVGGAALPGTITYSTGGEPVSAGTHTIECAFAGDGNYQPSADTATIAIGKAAATVTAGSGSKTYGQADPTLTPASTGFLMTDGIAVSQTPRDAGETVGSYATHATATGAALGNYAVTVTDGSLGVTPAPLTVTANSVSRHYGLPNPALTVSYAGFVFGENPSVLGGTLSVTTTATQFSAVGTYPIVPSALTSSNYAIAFVNGTLTVTNDDPVCSAAAPSVSLLWPANHQLVNVTVNGVTDPNGDAFTIAVVSIFQDEPTNTQGDGNTLIDGFGVGTSTAQVRAERSGTPRVPGDGRVYHITFTATDPAGGSCSATVKVGVPHDQGQRSTPVDGGALFKSTGGL